MKTQRERVFMADFETTVYEGQERTDVWAAAIVELYTEDVRIYGSIGKFFEAVFAVKCNCVIYFHNLKFDGGFILNYLYSNGAFREAAEKPMTGTAELEWIANKDMRSGMFKYVISDMGMWYSITIRVGKYFYEIRDSLKLLPFPVRKLGEDFKTKHRKLTMQYTGYRYPECPISDEERRYIANDVLVVKEALEIMYDAGHKKLTIGSCCLEEYKNLQPFYDYAKAFPDLYKIELDPEYGSPTAGDYIRNSYRGGWCYLVPKKANRIMKHGTTADVNSLYPSMMHSESGNWYPTGQPHFWKGPIPDGIVERSHSGGYGERVYYFVRVRTRFRIKKGKLPFLQIKTDRVHYKGNECLTTSDYYSRVDHRYHKYGVTPSGEKVRAHVILTLTMSDWELMQEQYDLEDTEVLDGCWFLSVTGMFDEYIEKYRKQKIESKGARRQIAKLFLNNLYGKMAMNKDNSFKVGLLDDAGAMSYYTVISATKKPGYIPVGSAITSYARCFTIRAAQANFYGSDRPGFIYADTDSIHCDLPPDQIKGITVHPNNFCCWKLESCWSEGLFVRQKCYAEYVTMKDLEPLPAEKIGWDLKCAGMPERSKLLYLTSIGDDAAHKQLQEKIDAGEYELSIVEQAYLKTNRTIHDFKIGLEAPGKLVPENIPGGVVLIEVPYKIRETFK